jgi:hypothetical protein
MMQHPLVHLVQCPLRYVENGTDDPETRIPAAHQLRDPFDLVVIGSEPVEVSDFCRDIGINSGEIKLFKWKRSPPVWQISFFGDLLFLGVLFLMLYRDIDQGGKFSAWKKRAR